MSKAYSILKVKSIDETPEQRVITGIASTPKQDRDNDIMEMNGVKFALPIPLLWQHNHNQPIGEVISAEVTDEGILITAKIAQIDEAGSLKNRIDEAWQSIKSGLVKCLSIGFRTLEYNYLEDSYGLHIKSWEWYELSAVTVPANPDAVITSAKQIKKAFANIENDLAEYQEPVTQQKQTAITSTKPKYITLVPRKGSIPLVTGDTL